MMCRVFRKSQTSRTHRVDPPTLRRHPCRNGSRWCRRNHPLSIRLLIPLRVPRATRTRLSVSVRCAVPLSPPTVVPSVLAFSRLPAFTTALINPVCVPTAQPVSRHSAVRGARMLRATRNHLSVSVRCAALLSQPTVVPSAISTNRLLMPVTILTSPVCVLTVPLVSHHSGARGARMPPAVRTRLSVSVRSAFPLFPPTAAPSATVISRPPVSARTLASPVCVLTVPLVSHHSAARSARMLLATMTHPSATVRSATHPSLLTTALSVTATNQLPARMTAPTSLACVLTALPASRRSGARSATMRLVMKTRPSATVRPAILRFPRTVALSATTISQLLALMTVPISLECVLTVLPVSHRSGAPPVSAPPRAPLATGTHRSVTARSATPPSPPTVAPSVPVVNPLAASPSVRNSPACALTAPPASRPSAARPASAPSNPSTRTPRRSPVHRRRLAQTVPSRSPRRPTAPVSPVSPTTPGSAPWKTHWQRSPALPAVTPPRRIPRGRPGVRARRTV
ncbi:hypothetical protein AGDE_14827 [Angomonas deanei]|nr:hypothetical protein AGDE_14827 [Angomonas deanei]|eukprot:EPY20182.1 hypothetical protein AGDE_14827 [Angomonas deanei]